MLVFTTKIPVKSTLTEKMFIDLCTEWVYGSPHYHNLEIKYDVSAHEDYEITKENVKCQITCYKDSNTSIVAFRLNNNDNGTIWIIDLLFIDDNGNRFISIQNNCNSRAYDPRFPKNHKPNFIKKIMENEYGADDLYFSVTDTPLICDKTNAVKYAEYICGTVKKPLPMVYVSKDFDSYTVDYNKLAKWLSGMAYVVVEDSKETSFLMKGLTDSKNAHNGYIGIYYPGSEKYQIYSSADVLSGELERSISLNLQQSLINHMSSDEYNWTQIQTLKAKAKLVKNENSSKELAEFIEYADNTEKELKEKIEYLQRTNDALTAQLESLKVKKQASTICLSTDLTDFYIDEQHDFVLYVMREIASKMHNPDEPKYRQYEILQSIINNNDITGENKRIIGELKRIFKPGFKWNSATKNKIKSLGFTISEGDHNKITFHDNKYMYTVASTPSDDRGIKNLMSEIEKGISISKKLL